MDIDDELKRLMKELGNAINESLSESDSIAEVIDAIKRAGYDVLLVLEGTIAFNKREEEEPEEPRPQVHTGEAPLPGAPNIPFDSRGRIKLTMQDERFLRALKIDFDDKLT